MALGPVHIANGSDIPEWAELLERYIDDISAAATLARAPVVHTAAWSASSGDDVPFGELLSPLADLAQVDLEARIGEALTRVAPPARAALRESLMQRLARLAAPLLYEGFDRHRSEHQSSAAHRGARAVQRPGPSRELYHDYMRRMLAGAMLRLLREYPVLARLLATTAILWREASAEFLWRLAADRDLISERFAGGRTLGDLVAVRPGISDAHCGGRTVYALTFACGLRLIYKPRGLGVDTAFGELLTWSTRHGAPLIAQSTPPALALATHGSRSHTEPFRIAPRVLDRHEYGWVDYAERRECRDIAEVRRYYERTGALLCLLHTLGSTDCHYENLISHADFPILIDVETVLQPDVARAQPPADHARNIGGRRLYDDSVLRTGMLPIWQSGGGDITYDVGGLTACAGQVTPFVTTRWTHVNTDAMRMVRERAEVGAYSNMPLLDGATVSPRDYVDEIVRGFSNMYRWLAANTDALLAVDGPVTRLARQQVRFIARPSSVYDHVLRRSLASDALRDGAARSVQLELLARGLLHISPQLWPLLRAEQSALEQLDIPVFTMRGADTSLALGDDNARVAVACSGLDVARSRFRALSSTDLAHQVQVIRGSFGLRYASDSDDDMGAEAREEDQSGRRAMGQERHRLDDSANDRGYGRAYSDNCGSESDREHRRDASSDVGQEEKRSDRRATDRSDESEACSRAELLAAAQDIADEIQRMATTGADGHVTWITIEPVSPAGRHRLQAVGYGLYSGLGGIALFLAAAARCGDRTELAALARRALLPLCQRLRTPHPTFVEEYGIGSASGAAAAVYTLLRTGTLLNDAALIDDAVRAAHQITPAVVTADRQYDVLYGSAGAILALLALHRTRPDAVLLERAVACGAHLLACRQPTPTSGGHRAWPTSSDRMLLGFSHGAAGIAYALMQLYAASGRADFRAAALDAISYEDALFMRGAGEWPDLRRPEGAASLGFVGATWCHGAAGIGLARLGCLAVEDLPYLRHDIERAIVRTVAGDATSPSCLDNLCCGSFGGIELLLTAGLRREMPALIAAARARASTILRQRRATGAYRLLPSSVAGVYDPALYQGTAGIGYGLLRLCLPQMCPSLLLWE